MADDKKPDTEVDESQSSEQQAPADALSRTPDELEEEEATRPKSAEQSAAEAAGEKKISPVRKLFRKLNLYFLIFILILVGVGVYTTVTYLNSQKVEPEAGIEPQELTEEALRDLANTDASVGSPSQTLTIQGNAIIDGQTLMRGNLNVAGNFQSGGRIQGPSLTISGESNLGTAQISSLQVAQNTAIQGNTTMRDLSVSGSATFAGAVTMPQLTVSRLTLGGNSVLEIANHLSVTGPPPSRGDVGNAVGAGGSATVNGSDTAGTVNVNTGSGTSAGCFVRVNFNQDFSTQPRVIVSPIGAGAGATQYYVDRNQSGFSLCTSAPAPANQSFAFDYFVVG